MLRRHLPFAAVAGLLLLSNVVVSSLLGLGDAEALYYTYSLHLSWSYLDHPPLIGWLIAGATALLGDRVLAVRSVSMVTAFLCLLFTTLTTRDMFGDRAARAVPLLLFATPVVSVGMVAAAPDAPLAALWSLFVWQLHRLFTDRRGGGWPRLGRPLLLGATLGLAFLAKYTGAGLVISSLILLVSKESQKWLARPGFYLGALAAAAGAAPVLYWNSTHGWAGVLHRLVWTQSDAGFSIRNLGALLGGQLLYAGPLMLVLFVLAIRDAFRRRADAGELAAADRVLLAASLPTLGLTYLLGLWSEAAEPHWPAVGYLPLFPLAARLVADGTPRVTSLARWALRFGVVVFASLHLLVLTPLLPALMPSSKYDPRHDLANELRGWPEVAEAVRGIHRDQQPVLAAFYTQCSQLVFQLSRPGDPQVRCISPETDDFDLWYGSFRLPPEGALFVTDNRFEHDVETLLPGAEQGARLTVEIGRADRTVRRFEILEVSPRGP